MSDLPTASYVVSSLTTPATGGRLSPERARKLREDLDGLRAARVRALAESRAYLVTGA